MLETRTIWAANGAKFGAWLDQTIENALEPELDGTNVDQALKALETLTELVQGNTTYANAQLLLQTKLVSILERLIEKKALEGGKEVALAEARDAIESGPG